MKEKWSLRLKGEELKVPKKLTTGHRQMSVKHAILLTIALIVIVILFERG